jgi:hypothetical protein
MIKASLLYFGKAIPSGEDRTNNKTMFLREGDNYNGIKIILVSVDKIKLSKEKEVKEIIIKR